MSIISENRINSIFQSFNSGNYYIELSLEFGKGIDSSINSNDNRTDYSVNDKFIIEEVVFDDGVKNYRIIGTESPLVAKISNIVVRNKEEDSDYKYTYGIGFAMDKEQPIYSCDINSEPNNIERDGNMWHINANTGGTYRLDQNANARYQMYLKKAKKAGDELSEDEKMFGVEETTDKTGEFYITIMVCESKIYSPSNTRGFAVTKGVTRSSRTTRGGSDDYDTGRVGYGNVASTSSSKSEMKYINSPKIIIPMRFKVLNSSEITDIMVSKDLSSAKTAEELQKMYKPKVF
jgi:hypothetical protein